jgi:hypothetical protein
MIKLFIDGPEMQPSAAATQTFGAIAAKGGGKSYLAGVAVEQLVGHNVPCIVIDPIGNWAWLKLHADGVQRGLDIAVLGGEHADLGIEADQGAAVGEHLVELEQSAVIDVSAFSKSKRKEFVADFCEALYRAARTRRTPRMVVFEEAQLFAPQHTQRGEERMLGAVTDIVRLGRNYGIGSMLVTQRPQSVSKEVLNQIECLLVGGLRGPHERKAIAGWVTEVGEANLGLQLQPMLDRLPQLQPGEFMCWSPSWLKYAGMVLRAVLDWWRAHGLGDYERETLDALVKHGRRTGLTRQQIAEATGHSVKSSTFADALRRLSRIGICDVPKTGPVTFTADARDAMGL